MKILIIVFLILISAPAYALTGSQLIENAKLFDNKPVELQGEVIGDIMERGNYVWMNINDSTLAIGIWADQELVQGIKKTGDYNTLGDTIKVAGVFNRACKEHGGELDIHAQVIEVIKIGAKIEHPIDQNKVVVAVILLVLILAMLNLPRLILRKIT